MVSIYLVNYLLWVYCVVDFVLGFGDIVVGIIQEVIVVVQMRVDKSLKVSRNGCKSRILIKLIRRVN